MINGATREQLIAEDPKSVEIIKPFLRGRDVKRWQVEFANQYLIKIESSENKPHSWSGKKTLDAEIEFARCYPAIHAHFEDYRQGMIDRYDQGRFFWELRACVYWDEFERPKVVVPAITVMVNYTPDTKGYFSNDKTSIVVSQEWRYLSANLNSTLCQPKAFRHGKSAIRCGNMAKNAWREELLSGCDRARQIISQGGS